MELIINRVSHFYSRANFPKLLFLFSCWTILIFSSSETNDGFINKADAQTCATNLPISTVTASASQSGNPPTNVLDNSLSTRWANNGIG